MFKTRLQQLFSLGTLAAVATACSQAEPSGTLEIRANGEDFVRKGFVSKDDWQIEFDHVYVILNDVAAYQTEPPFDPEGTELLQSTETIAIDESVKVDLAEGDETAEPRLVKAMDAPSGRFNALSWSLISQGEAPLVLIGTATKVDQIIPFQIALSPSLKFTCGDFVGDERKGILESGEIADVEATFHFDHLFGDADLPADDELNQGALGFEPLAEMASDSLLEVTQADLKQQLSESDYEKLQIIFSGLGHVGEGHCASEMVESEAVEAGEVDG